MVTTKSGSDTNRVIISNNAAKYYADSAQGYANQAKNSADTAKQAESNVTELIKNENLSVVTENIENINTVAENIENLGGISLEWGNIQGDISSQTDLKTELGKKINDTDLSDWAKQETKPTYTKSEIGLGSVDNTSDMNKPVSTAVKTALDAKADKSSLATVATSGSYSDLSNKPTIPTVPSNITTQGNSFNAANQLVKLDSSGKLPAIDGSQLTGITSSGGGSGLAVDSEVTSMTGTVSLVTNKMYSAKQTGNIVFTLPTEVDRTIFNQIIVQLDINSTYTIDFGTEYYASNEAPDVTAGGDYNIKFEYNNLKKKWIVNVVYCGDLPDAAGGSEGGGGGGEWGDLWG